MKPGVAPTGRSEDASGVQNLAPDATLYGDWVVFEGTGAQMRASLISLGILLGACGGPSATDSPTWNHDVLPLFEEHCSSCHTEGGLAPMPLDVYDDLYAVSPSGDGLVHESLPWALSTGWMPPSTEMAECIDYVGADRSVLDETELSIVMDWIDAEVPEGDGEPRHWNPPTSFADSLGTPHFIARPPEPYFPSYGNDDSDYACFLLDPELTETAWIGAVTPKIDNKRIVHHMLLFRMPVSDRETCGGEELLNDLLAGWAPGQEGWFLPEDVGYKLEPGERLALQIHYDKTNDNGRDDRSGLELHFIDDAVHEAGVLWTGTIFASPEGESGGFGEFVIPAGDPAFEVSGTCTVTEAMGPLTVFGAWPHMHQIGSHLSASVHRGKWDEVGTCMVDVPWDFDDQRGYRFVDPIQLTPGDRIETSCVFDNSGNDYDVRFGEGTSDEMCFDFLMYYPATDLQYCLF